MTCSLIRLIDAKLSDIKGIENLKLATHDPDAAFDKAPHIVSCTTGVRYLLERSLGNSF